MGGRTSTAKPRRLQFHPAIHGGWVGRWRRDESGAVQVESALSYVLIFTCMLGIMEFCMMVYTYSVYADAARDGVRYAVMHGVDSTNCSGPSTGCGDTSGVNVVNEVNTYAANYAASISGMKVAVSYPDSGGSTPPSRVIVTITYTYAPMFNLPGFHQAFHISAQGRVLY
jgi:hypothetical protein